MDNDLMTVKGDVIRLYERLDVVNGKLDKLESLIETLTRTITSIEKQEGNKALEQKKFIIDSIVKLILSSSGVAFLYKVFTGGMK